jgi:hypothetical protein
MQDTRATIGRNVLEKDHDGAIHKEVLYLRTHCKAIRGAQGRLFTDRSNTGGSLLALGDIMESYSWGGGRKEAVLAVGSGEVIHAGV